MLMTIDPEDDLGAAERLPVRDTRPAAAVLFCSVTTFLAGDGTPNYRDAVSAYLGPRAADPDWVRLASPAERVTGREPPTLLIAGEVDTLTPAHIHALMCDRLQEKGVAAELVVVPHGQHGFEIAYQTPEVVARVDAFLRTHLGGGA